VANAIDAQDDPVTYITIKSSTVAVGGNDQESLAAIKRNAPRLRRVQDRAVTLKDYEDIIKGYDGVVKAHTLSSVSSGAVTVNYSALPSYPNFETRNSDTAVSLTADFGTAGTTIHSNLADYLTARSMVGVAVNQISTTINFDNVYIAFSRLEVIDGYYQTEVTDAVTAALRLLFTWDAVEFNQTFRASDILSTVNAVTGVKNATLSNLSANSSGTSTADYAITATTSSAVRLPVLRTITYSGVTGGIS
jgi:hypothetical protein